MGKINSKQKGKNGELELVHEIERVLKVEARRGQQFCGSPDSPDVVVAIPGVYWECKRTESLSLYKAMEQAIDDCGEDVPIVAHRRSRKPWLVVVRLDDLPKLVTQIYLTMAERN